MLLFVFLPPFLFEKERQIFSVQCNTTLLYVSHTQLTSSKIQPRVDFDLSNCQSAKLQTVYVVCFKTTTKK